MLANEAQTDVNVILPPAKMSWKDKRIKISLVVNKSTYLLIKTCSKKLFIMGYTAEIDTFTQEEDENDQEPSTSSNVILPGILNLKLGKVTEMVT